MSENRILELAMESLKEVKRNDSNYQNLTLDEKVVILGSASPFDSIGFTTFAIGLEERIEDVLGISYSLDVPQLYSPGERGLTVRQLAERIEKQLAHCAPK